ncbi:MAG TPA: prepilin-type N-terminal cleavage/methylation domain-containing protein [Elusimicrobiota bacterium]|nr:prepilin-type N-terminal cleavage/methylation domain-containing protein [Elusimicrobiota bacterium]
MAARKVHPAGFTLIEVLVCVMIIGILSALAVPQYFKSIEHDKASEAVNLMMALKSAQDRYWAKYGVYCNAAIAACSGFDYDPPPLKYYNAMPAFTAGSAGNQSWSLVLTRNQTPAVYGAYKMTYDIEPNAAPKMTCDNSSCVQDLIPK